MRLRPLRFILLVFLGINPCRAETNSVMSGTNGFVVDLPTVLRLAEARNIDVQIARQFVAEARANYSSGLEQFFPWISPGVQFRRYDGLGQAFPSGVLSDGHFESYAPGARVGAQVALGEAIYGALAAKQNLHATREALEAQREEAALSAAQKYFELVRATALVEVQRDAVRISRGYLEQLHSGVEAGIAFRGDELRVKSESERYQIALRQAQERVRTLAAQLAQILHLDPGVELRSEDAGVTQIRVIADEPSLDVLIQKALHQRNELEQALALTAVAEENRKAAAYGPLVPSLGIQYYAGGFGGAPDHLPDRFGTAQDFSATLGWRIGPGGLFDVSRIKADKARAEAAKLRAEKLKDEVIRQVVEAHTLVQSLADQIPAARQNLETATESLRLARERKEFGVGIVLEDIQAQQELVRARADYLTTVADYNKAQFALRRAVGETRDTTGVGLH